MAKLVNLALALYCALLASPAAAGQKPTAPVDIKYAPLPVIRPGEEATTAVTFRAEADLDRLEVSVAAGEGLTLLTEKPEATFERVKKDETRVITVRLRLNAPWGFLSAFATTTQGGQQRKQVASVLVGRREKALAPNAYGPEEDLAKLTLLNSTGSNAVVRFGAKPLQVISVGDRLGKNQAEVKAIEADRLLLEETFIGPDGKPNRAQIVLKKGETGGTRYLVRPETDAPPARRPVVVQPPDGTKVPQK